MSAVSYGKVEAQVNTFFRMKHWSETKRYKAVQSNAIVDQYRYDVMALKEEEKFLNYIDETEWPTNMETTKENILRTTISDSQLNSNSGNDNDVLPSILRSFKRLHPAKARAIEQASLLEASPSTDKHSGTDVTDVPTDSSPGTVEEPTSQAEVEDTAQHEFDIVTIK